jgi:hypothetical protein
LELLIVRRILDISGEASGMAVNYNKTSATFIREETGHADSVREIMDCEIKSFPLKYLGMQLALRPLTKAEWQPKIDKVVNCVPAWQSGMIQKAGRLILIKSVITARPIHQMIVAEAPVWVLDEIVKWLRAFFWAGKKQVNGGQCLVSWEAICRPLCHGGLGVKDLRLHGLALRTRWCWLRRTDQSRPWQGLPALPDREANAVFQSLAIFKVGNGEKIFFWKDRWINGRSVEDIAPEVAALVTTRRKNARKIAGALPNNTWFTDIQGELSLEGWVECIMLSEEIERVEVDPSVPDVIAWKGSSSGVYSAKATYNMLCQGNITWQMAGPIWRCFAPLKCNFFGWLAIKYRLWTSDRRTRHGLQERPDPCATCLQSEDNVDHILVQCPYARMVWFGCLREFGLNLPEPQQHANLERWWTEAPKRIRKEDRR